jgi:uncharacterized protein (DUF2141 family)
VNASGGATYTISGSIDFSGMAAPPASGTAIQVGLFDQIPDETTSPMDGQILTADGSGSLAYSFTDVPGGSYGVGVFVDSDGDSNPDPEEATGWYPLDAFYDITLAPVSSDVTDWNVEVYEPAGASITGNVLIPPSLVGAYDSLEIMLLVWDSATGTYLIEDQYQEFIGDEDMILYEFYGLAAGEYRVEAWYDADNDGTENDGDYVGGFTFGFVGDGANVSADFEVAQKTTGSGVTGGIY